jgi:predicted RNA-binding Zn-ribbon protein involved in translation (DUF1610 family)
MPEDVTLDARDLVPEDAESRACPSCGESIKKVAIRCRHCQEQLGDPACPGIFRDGKQVVMSRFGAFPPRCVKTNRPAEHWLTQRLSCLPSYAPVLMLLGPLFIFPVLASERNTARVRLPLSAQQFRRRRLGQIMGALILFTGLGAIVAGILVDRRNGDNWMVSLLVGGLIAVFAGGLTIAHVTRPVKLTRIAKNHIWLKGVHPAMRAEFPEWRVY